MGILTTQGADKLALKISQNQTLDLSNFQVGDASGTPYTPVASQTSLVNSRYTGTITAKKVNGNTISLQCVLPAEIGGWHIREVGIFDTDGLLIGVAEVPERYKPALSGDVSAIITIDVLLTLSSTESITLVVDSEVYITAGYVDTKITDHENKSSNAHKISAIIGLSDALNNKQNIIQDNGLEITKLNISGATDISANLLDTDLLVVNNKKSAMSRIWAYVSSKLTGAISTVATSNLTASRALVSDTNGKISASSISSTILGYLANASSDIQAQLNNKLSTSGNAASATKLQTARTINLTGGVTGTANFDGSSNINIATTIAKISNEQSLTPEGYIKLPGGLIMQWGKRLNGGIGFYPVTFPIPFPNAVLSIQATYIRASYTDHIRAVASYSLTGAEIGTDGCDTFWYAIGI